jgi:mRNA degradation ribonuclease J1/J2
MNFVKYEQLIATTKFKSNNVLLIDNGQIVKFVNDQIEKIPVKKSNIKIAEQNIRSHGYIDIHASHLIESQQMASDGCVLISLLIDRQEKKIIKFNYNPVGVINLLNEKNKQKLVEINTILNNHMNEILDKFVDQNNLLTKKLQDEFKKEVIKLYQKNFGKKPLILITIIYNNSIVQQKKIEYENR